MVQIDDDHRRRLAHRCFASWPKATSKDLHDKVDDCPQVVWACTEGVPSTIAPPQREEIVVIGGLGDASSPARRLDGGFCVRLPEQALEVHNGITYFAVDVFPDTDNVAPWRVMRRYTEFHDLARGVNRDVGWQRWRPRSVDRSCFALSPFPMKLPKACRGKALTARRLQLEQWLNRLVTQHSWHSHSGDHLCRFLLLGRAIVPASSLRPSVPAAVRPWQALGNSAVEDMQALTFVWVRLPADVGACQEITIKVPNYHTCLGGQVTINVPWGTLPGAVLGLWFDPQSGTLGVAHSFDWQAGNGAV